MTTRGYNNYKRFNKKIDSLFLKNTKFNKLLKTVTQYITKMWELS